MLDKNQNIPTTTLLKQFCASIFMQALVPTKQATPNVGPRPYPRGPNTPGQASSPHTFPMGVAPKNWIVGLINDNAPRRAYLIELRAQIPLSRHE